MTQSVYIIGGAGTGKSTFTAQLLEGRGFGPLIDLHSKKNAKAVVTLRGHWVGMGGLYLGCMRDEFPGTDGLDRATSPTGAEWLHTRDLPNWIVSEGATLATRPFMNALAETTDLLVVHLLADEDTKLARFAQRGSSQRPEFVLATATRSHNLFVDMAKRGDVRMLAVDTTDEFAWDFAQDRCSDHLWKTFSRDD